MGILLLLELPMSWRPVGRDWLPRPWILGDYEWGRLHPHLLLELCQPLGSLLFRVISGAVTI